MIFTHKLTAAVAELNSSIQGLTAMLANHQASPAKQLTSLACEVLPRQEKRALVAMVF